MRLLEYPHAHQYLPITGVEKYKMNSKIETCTRMSMSMKYFEMSDIRDIKI